MVEIYPEIVDYMIELIVADATENGFVYNYLNDQWNSSCPQYHNGSWVVWLDDAPSNDKIREC